MRTWLYDTLTTAPAIVDALGVDKVKSLVKPRRSEDTVPTDDKYIVFGLGNSSAERLTDSTSTEVDPERQFFQVWIYDKDDSYVWIDEMVEVVKRTLTGGKSPPHGILTVAYLETSGEFNNQTLNTNFRYIRFQAVLRRTT